MQAYMSVHVHMYIYIYICVCVCDNDICVEFECKCLCRIYMYIYIYIYIHACIHTYILLYGICIYKHRYTLCTWADGCVHAHTSIKPGKPRTFKP